MNEFGPVLTVVFFHRLEFWISSILSPNTPDADAILPSEGPDWGILLDFLVLEDL